MSDPKIEQLLRSLSEINLEAARLRKGKRAVDMTDEERRAYNEAVFELMRKASR